MTHMRSTITITPVFVADLHVEGERMPIYVHVIDHPDGRVLVDTGMTGLHPLLADMDPRLRPLSEQDFDLAGIDIVVNTQLHFDHRHSTRCTPGQPCASVKRRTYSRPAPLVRRAHRSSRCGAEVSPPDVGGMNRTTHR